MKQQQQQRQESIAQGGNSNIPEFPLASDTDDHTNTTWSQS